MPRKVEDSVVVVTGASSGIGRATARAFAASGAAVVLAARREEALREAAAECERRSGRALAVPTDVTNEADVHALARRAAEEFGRIDTWVNNAGVYAVARFEETPAEIFRRVLETNFFGCVHGARAVLPYFRDQESGVLVMNASVDAEIPAPYVSAYVASKWALRGFSHSLRLELRDARDVHVSVLLPASIDTPFFQHAANYSGRRVVPLSPVYPPEKVAEAIVRLAERPRRELVVGGAGRVLALEHRLAPGLTERAFAKQADKDHFEDAPAEATEGNVLRALPEWTGASGGWEGRKPSGRRLSRAALAGTAALVPAALAALWLRR